MNIPNLGNVIPVLGAAAETFRVVADYRLGAFFLGYLTDAVDAYLQERTAQAWAMMNAEERTEAKIRTWQWAWVTLGGWEHSRRLHNECVGCGVAGVEYPKRPGHYRCPRCDYRWATMEVAVSDDGDRQFEAYQKARGR